MAFNICVKPVLSLVPFLSECVAAVSLEFLYNYLGCIILPSCDIPFQLVQSLLYVLPVLSNFVH